MKLHTKKFQIL